MFFQKSNKTPNVVFNTPELVVVGIEKSFNKWTVRYAKRSELRSTSCFDIGESTSGGYIGQYEYRVLWS